MENAVNAGLVKAFGYLPEHTKRNWDYILRYAYNGEPTLVGYGPFHGGHYETIASWPVGAWAEAREAIAGSIFSDVKIKDFGPVEVTTA